MKANLFVILLSLSFVTHSQIITTVAGGGTSGLGDGGLATNANIAYFAGLLVDQNYNIYISQGSNHRIRKVDAVTGTIKTIVGTGFAGYNGDGIQSTAAQISSPGCIAFDSSYNLYLYDYGNNRIRKIDVVTGLINTYVGNGSFGSAGDGGPATAAEIDGGEMYFDAANNLYLIGSRKIRKITPSGFISTFAGNGLVGVTGDGVPASATYLAEVRGIAIDIHGNIYLADSTASIRKITTSTGLIHRVAGTGDNITGPYSGDGLAATACHIGPFDISVDDTGNLYIPDFANSRIEKVDTFGIIHTIAGTGIAGFSGDGSSAVIAEISHPENVVLDKCNNVYIDDFNNKRVRKVTYHPICDIMLDIKLSSNSISVSIYPNPVNELLNIDNVQTPIAYKLLNILGASMQQDFLQKGKNTISIQALPLGLYLLELTDEDGKRTVTKIIKQ